MSCATCGKEHVLLRDDERGLYRALCACEVTQACHKCKRGKVNHVVLDRSGEVDYYACAKHGTGEAQGILPPGHGAEAPKARAKKPAPTAEPPPPSTWTHGTGQLLRCGTCQKTWVSGPNGVSVCPYDGCSPTDAQVVGEVEFDAQRHEGPRGVTLVLMLRGAQGLGDGALTFHGTHRRTGDG